MNLAAFLISISITIGWGVTWYLTARASKKLGALRSLFIFQLVGVPFALPFFSFINVSIAPENIINIILLGGLITISMMIFFYATEIGDISIVNPISEIHPLVIFFLGIFFFKESVSSYKFIAAFLVFLGVILLGTDFKSIYKKSAKTFKGVNWAIVSSFTAGISIFLSSVVSRSGHWLATTFGVRVTISIITLLILLYKRNKFRSLFDSIPWRWVLPAAAFDVVSFALYNYASVQFEVSYVAAFISAQSLVAVLLAHIFMKERLKKYQYIGLPLIVVGLVLLNFV